MDRRSPTVPSTPSTPVMGEPDFGAMNEGDDFTMDQDDFAPLADGTESSSRTMGASDSESSPRPTITGQTTTVGSALSKHTELGTSNDAMDAEEGESVILDSKCLLLNFVCARDAKRFRPNGSKHR